MHETVTPYATPALLDAVIQPALASLQALPWLETVYPVAQIGRVNTDLERSATATRQASAGGLLRYPTVYRNDGKTYQVIIAPDRDKASFAFFEREAPYGVATNDLTTNSGQFTYALSLVVWLNLPKIDSLRNYDFTEELVQDCLEYGLLTALDAVTNIAIERRQEAVFNKYDYNLAEKQFLLYPYSGFKISFSTTAPYGLVCIDPWTQRPAV